MASGDGKWRRGHTTTRSITAGKGKFSEVLKERPRHDSNVRTRLRRPLLYPLSYGGFRAGKRLPARDVALGQRARRARLSRRRVGRVGAGSPRDALASRRGGGSGTRARGGRR